MQVLPFYTLAVSYCLSAFGVIHNHRNAIPAHLSSLGVYTLRDNVENVGFGVVSYMFY